MWISNNGMTCLSAFAMACGFGHMGDIFCMCTHRKSLSHSLPRRRPASPRILIQHASPEDDRYPFVDPELLSPRAWLDLMPLLYDSNPFSFLLHSSEWSLFNVSLIPKVLLFFFNVYFHQYKEHVLLNQTEIHLVQLGLIGFRQMSSSTLYLQLPLPLLLFSKFWYCCE